MVPVEKGVDSLRVACAERLPEVEFNLRRGTTTNSYLLKASGGAWGEGCQEAACTRVLSPAGRGGASPALLPRPCPPTANAHH